jgi:hypothetical protein
MNLTKLTRREFNLTIGAGIGGAALLPLAGCPGGTVTEVTLALGLIETAAQSFVGILAPQDAPMIALATNILNEVPPTLKELASSDSASTKFTVISGYFVTALATVIPNGSKYFALGEDLLADIKNFLAVIDPAPAAAAKADSARDAVIAKSPIKPKAKATKPWDGKLSSGDKKALPMIAEENSQLLAKVAALGSK